MENLTRNVWLTKQHNNPLYVEPSVKAVNNAILIHLTTINWLTSPMLEVVINIV